MDYEKAYKAVLKTATQWIKDGCTDKEKICLECVFPELRESEDERIRKALIDTLKVSETIGELKFRLPYPTREECIAYLEKQKEQRPALSEVELLFRGEKVTVKRPFYRDDKGRGYSTTEQDEEVAWNALRAWCEKKGISLYDLYPKAEWSEEDADILNCCISSIEEAKENRYAYKETDGDTSYDHEIAWLKSLRPSWKPNEEHLSALLAVFNDPNNIGSQTCQLALSDLYEQLKKL